jgi:hypothetical protein
MTDDWVTVGDYDDPHDAEWAKARLELDGIDASLAERDDGNTSLRVRPAATALARKLLAEDGLPPAADDDRFDPHPGPGPPGVEEDVETDDGEEDETPQLPPEIDRALEQGILFSFFAILVPPLTIFVTWKLIGVLRSGVRLGWAAIVIILVVGLR